MRWRRALLPCLLLVLPAQGSRASEAEKPVPRSYALVKASPAPAQQSIADVAAKSRGCISCHSKSDAASMHVSPAVRLGCTDCHGGNAGVPGNPALPRDDPVYAGARDSAHVLPRFPVVWHYPSSANPQRSYTLLNREAP